MDYKRTDSALYRLLLSGTRHALPKGQILSAYDDRVALYLIKSGDIKRYFVNPDGDEGIQVIYGPGDIFPLTPVYSAVFDMNIYSGSEDYFYEAMTKLEIYAISQDRLLAALEADPLIYKDLFHAAGLRLNSYIHRLESISLRASNRKIAHQLVYFADLFGEQTPEGIKINLPLTHQDMADVLGLARETVWKQMNSLTTRGILVPGRQLIIGDLKRLKKIAQITEEDDR